MYYRFDKRFTLLFQALNAMRKELQGVHDVLDGTNQEIRSLRESSADEEDGESKEKKMIALSDTADATIDWSESNELLQYTAERDLPLGPNWALGIK